MTLGYTYQLLSRAEKEYLESYLWYEKQQDGLGERFAIAIRKRLQYISLDPNQNSKKKGKFHETQLGKPFPFIVIFIVDKKNKNIIITSIFHTRRDPKNKYK
jgi:hypothetical protein